LAAAAPATAAAWLMTKTRRGVIARLTNAF
jgi:hypothetical protein